MADINVEINRGAPYVQKVKMAYKYAQGPYEESAQIFDEVSKIAPGAKWIGLYYDNPEKVRAADLRYAAGALLCEGEGTVDPGLQSELEKAGFQMFLLPHVDCHVRTTFPYVRGSNSHKQVYPQLMTYIDEHKLDINVMVHIYSKGEVQVMGPQENTDEFLVPEARASVKVEISRGASYVQKVKMAYKYAQGPYEESAQIFDEVSKIAPGAKWIGLYYDNPEKVRAADLRYAAGALLCEGEGTVDPGLQTELEKSGFQMFLLPHVECHVRTTFPYVRGSHSHRQVYPQLMTYIDEHNLDIDVVVHIYSMGEVQVMAPQENTDEFFVPEARAAEAVQQQTSQ